MGKGQRERKQQAAAAAAAILEKPKKAAPSPFTLSSTAPVFVPPSTSGTFKREPSPPISAAPPKETLKIDYGLMSKFFAKDQESRMRILNTFVSGNVVAAIADMTISDETPDKFNFNGPEIAHIIRRYGVASVEGSLLLNDIVTVMRSQPTAALALEGALRALVSLQLTIEHDIEPVLVALLPEIFTFQGHKTPNCRELASQLLTHLTSTISPLAIHEICPAILSAIAPENDWKCRVGALDMLNGVALRAKEGISVLLPHLIPSLSDCMKDAKKQVAASATAATNTACSFIHNDDISHIVPELVSVISHPEKIAKVLDMLLETTFVATVDAPTLSLITPLLSKCLRDRASLMKRKASKIIENMCKLVQNPSDVEPFVPLLLPNLTKVRPSLSIPPTLPTRIHILIPYRTIILSPHPLTLSLHPLRLLMRCPTQKCVRWPP